MEILCKSTQETKDLAGRVAEKSRPGDVIALYGDLGSGKTTFVRFFVEALGLHARVQSPTFIISRKYSGDININHIDLYRIQDSMEVRDLGIDEMFTEKKSITLIEWPELLEDILPENCVKIRFEYVDENTRRINVQGLR